MEMKQKTFISFLIILVDNKLSTYSSLSPERSVLSSERAVLLLKYILIPFSAILVTDSSSLKRHQIFQMKAAVSMIKPTMQQNSCSS